MSYVQYAHIAHGINIFIAQTDIESFTSGVIESVIRGHPLSEEEAKELISREQKGPRRACVLRVLAAAHRDGNDNQKYGVSTRLGKGLSANLLDPQVSESVSE